MFLVKISLFLLWMVLFSLDFFFSLFNEILNCIYWFKSVVFLPIMYQHVGPMIAVLSVTKLMNALLPLSVTILRLVVQAEMNTEMVAVEMDIQVAYLDHMGAVVEVEEHIMIAEAIAATMRDMIQVLMLLLGVQIQRMGMMAWEIFQVQRFKIHLARKLSQVVGVLVEVVVETAAGLMVVAVAVAGPAELVPMTMPAGVNKVVVG